MVTCCPLESSDEGGPEVHDTSFPIARKEHQCTECRDPIPKGAKHELTKGLWDGRWDTFRTCMMCREIRDHFACSGFIYGQVWDDIEENFFPDMKCGGVCMDGLSPAAKTHLINARMEWLFSKDEYEQGNWEDWPKNKDVQHSRYVKPPLDPDADWEQYSKEREYDLECKRFEYSRPR